MNNTEEFRNQIMWTINNQCNFHCMYCWQSHNNKEVLNPIDLNKLSAGLNCLQKVWVFCISGGEPFLEKNFVDICKIISERHYLGIITNLSTANVYDFADKINPARCFYINAAIHIAEREKRDKNLSSFIDKVLYLQEKGFNITAQYVAHPVLFDRIKSDIKYLKGQGISNVQYKTFYGVHDGKDYPASFSHEQKLFLEGLGLNHFEFDILTKPHSFYRKLCDTGQRFFLMDRNGNLNRCSSILKKCGNLFEKSIKFDIEPKPCPKKRCYCPYEGIIYSSDKEGSTYALLKEEIIEKSFMLKVLKREINNIRVLKKFGIRI